MPGPCNSKLETLKGYKTRNRLYSEEPHHKPIRYREDIQIARFQNLFGEDVPRGKIVEGIAALQGRHFQQKNIQIKISFD